MNTDLGTPHCSGAADRRHAGRVATWFDSDQTHAASTFATVAAGRARAGLRRWRARTATAPALRPRLGRAAALLVLAVLATATHASGACRSVGTQLECDLGTGRAIIGTQTAAAPRYARAFHPFHATALPAERTAAARPLVVELQDVGADPGLCRRIGNETYCY